MPFVYDALPVSIPDRNTPSAPDTDTDARLVAAAQAGEVQAFESLVRKYRNEVYALSYHFLRNREEAWDTAQEVFIKAYRSLHRFRGDAAFKTWLMRITANQCKDHLKKRRLDTVSFDETIGLETRDHALEPGRQSEAAEVSAAIDAAVAELSDKHRDVFVLREYEGLSYEEIAQVMECNIGTVMSRLHHARKKLQNSLVRMGFAEGRS
jgi:RNA polymerase sigma-70 factor (ECF subfamily)